jgi:gamma-glutamylcyclotransferase (GGCT)/AIG2-like uncharacterized protein YtfP
MHLFAYGTLMFPEVWRFVVGREFAGEGAEIKGFAVFRVRNGVYPVMITESADAAVRGIVYQDLDDATVAKLDAYESELYDRVTVTASVDSGGLLACEAYVLPHARAELATREPWDAAKFQRDELPPYLNRLMTLG